MYLQGDLQIVFDALYHLGVIDPVLEMDWSSAIQERDLHLRLIDQVLHVANKCQGDVEQLTCELQKFDEKTLSYLAMEVAREFADFHAREDLH
jgi:hypothetical protein